MTPISVNGILHQYIWSGSGSGEWGWVVRPDQSAKYPLCRRPKYCGLRSSLSVISQTLSHTPMTWSKSLNTLTTVYGLMAPTGRWALFHLVNHGMPIKETILFGLAGLKSRQNGTDKQTSSPSKLLRSSHQSFSAPSVSWQQVIETNSVKINQSDIQSLQS